MCSQMCPMFANVFAHVSAICENKYSFAKVNTLSRKRTRRVWKLEWGWNPHAETNYASAKVSQKWDPFLIFDLMWCHLSSEASSGEASSGVTCCGLYLMVFFSFLLWCDRYGSAVTPTSGFCIGPMFESRWWAFLTFCSFYEGFSSLRFHSYVH